MNLKLNSSESQKKKKKLLTFGSVSSILIVEIADFEFGENWFDYCSVSRAWFPMTVTFSSLMNHKVQLSSKSILSDIAAMNLF